MDREAMEGRPSAYDDGSTAVAHVPMATLVRKPPIELPEVAQQDLQALAEWRYQIRKFLSFSEEAARSVGLEPQHHQLLLAIKGLPSGKRPTISVLAERMAVRHHTVVELVDRLTVRGLVKRIGCPRDRRSVLVELTTRAEHLLRRLSEQHRAQLRVAGPALIRTIAAVLETLPPDEPAAPPPPSADLEAS
jgi:DNA-binding MarR family transcriptional regulator